VSAHEDEMSIAEWEAQVEARQMLRDASRAERDRQYREALGLPLEGKLPKALGQPQGTGWIRYHDLRGTKRLGGAA
jgi:hypothetical protein